MDKIPWSDKEVERMKVMIEARATLDDLCNVLRARTRASIGQKLRLLRWKIYAPDPDINEAEFKRFLKERGK